MEPQAIHNSMKVAAVVAFYMSAALVMVFVNKAVLNSTPELPMLFLFNQLVLAVVLLHGAALITSKVEIPKMEFKTVKALTPITLVNVLGLVFNMLCLRGVDASFFQIARGLVLPLTIAVSLLHTRSVPSVKVLLAAGSVTLGFIVGVAPNTLSSIQWLSAPDGLSIFYGILSSLLIALAYWQNLGSAILLVPFIFLEGEYSQLLRLWSRPDWNGGVFIWGSIITGVFGFLLCVAGLLSIKVTSPVTHMFSSAARSVLQTLLGVWLFNDILTTNRATSILVILLGTMYYTWAKSVESAPSHQPTLPQQNTNPDLEKGEKTDA